MKVNVIALHRSNYPDPIEFSTGELLRLGRRDHEYPGWIRVILASGNEGWAPESLIDENAVALDDYTARELNVEVGESVIWHRELAGWVWVENEKGESGWVPESAICARGHGRESE
jgi:SH3-like domain-containing protein